MGLDALNGNGITKKIYYLAQDKATILSSEPLERVRPSRILLFVMTQIIGFGATMAITRTIGASDSLVCFLSRTGTIHLLRRTSCNWISYHLTPYTFPHGRYPEASLHRGGAGSP